MIDPRIHLKNPWLAAVLAYLIPGAGHLYQGRTFKGVLYAVCILGTFLSGMALGDWKVVYYRSDPGNRTLGYFSQVLVGLPALPAIVQAKRASHPDNAPQPTLDRPLETTFQGKLQRYDGTDPVQVTGGLTMQVESTRLGPELRGKFVGTSTAGEPVELKLGRARLGPKIGADRRRDARIDVLDAEERMVGQIDGGIPRRFVDWFQAPVSDKGLQELHGKLGKTFELAMVFTWIAGLLNLLAIWDALEGPAYGYGDEEAASDQPSPDTARSSDSAASSTTPAKKTVAEAVTPAAGPHD